MGVLQPLLQTQGGGVQNLVAPLGPVALVLGHERRGGHRAGEPGVGQVQIKGGPPALPAGVGPIGIHPLPLVDQPVHVDLADGEAGGKSPLGQNGTVFRHDVVAGKHQIGGGFALTGVGVHIAAHQPSALAGHQAPAVGRLTCQLIGGGQVQDQGGARPGQVDGGGLGGPQILADLHADHQIGHIVAGKQVAVRQGDILPAQGNGGLHPGPGGKPPLLIELPVVGQIGLGYQAQNLSALYHSSAIIQFVVPFVPYGQTNGGHHVQILGGLQNGGQALLRPFQQGGLKEQVGTGVAGEAQLGQSQHLDPLLVRLPHESKDLFRIITAVGHPDLGGTGGYLDKSIAHITRLLCSGSFSSEYDTPNRTILQRRSGQEEQNPAGNRQSRSRQGLS